MEEESIFICSGKVNLNDFHLCKDGPLMRGELDKILFTENELINTVNLFDSLQSTSTAILQLDHFTKCMEMQLKILNRCETFNSSALDVKSKETDLHHVRKSVCDLLLYIRTYLNNLEPQWTFVQHTLLSNLQNDIDKFLKCTEKFLARLRRIPATIFHYAVSNVGNKCSQPEFHLYHMHLELRWLIITIVYVRTNKWQITEGLTEDLNRIIELVINDLIYISLKIFERTSLADLRQKSPYSCTCVRELWLLLEILIEDIYDRLKFRTFWGYVNSILDTILKPSGERFSWNEEKTSLPECKKPETFAIWLMYHLTMLQGYNKMGSYIGPICNRVTENYEQLDRILKSFSNRSIKAGLKDDLDEELKVIIPILRLITEEWWRTRMVVINYLWECFHRRLELPFLVQVSGPWLMSLEKKSPADILKGVKDRLNGHFDQGNESSYSMFLRFLGSILRMGKEKGDSKHWQQVKGRIYSKFTKAKLQEFKESALINFISLFLTLAMTTTDVVNVCAVMLDLLPGVSEAESGNSRRASISWKGQLTVLLVYMEHDLHLEPVTQKLINTVNVVSCRKDELGRNMMSSFVETIQIIFNNSTKLDRGEHNCIGGWIDRFLLECSQNQSSSILKMLLDVFKKVQDIYSTSTKSTEAPKMLETLWSVVAGRIRLMAFEVNLNDENYQDLTKLGVMFTAEAIRDPILAKTYGHSATSMFMLFSSTNSVKDVRITKLYVSLILARTDIVKALSGQLKNFDLMIMQAWLKCCFHGHDGATGEIRRIKSYIVEVDDFKLVLPYRLQAHEFQESNESVIMFTTALATRRNELSDDKRLQLESRTRLLFNHFEKWVLLPIKEETKDTNLSYWIYRCLGTFFLACSSILHTKNQSSPLKNYLTKFMLPADEQQAYLKQLGKRIVSMVILGLESANARTDVTLHNLIIDIFQCYLPLLVTDNQQGMFKVSESLLKCFTDAQPEFVAFLLEKLSITFIKIATDSMHKHGYLFMVLLSTLLKLESISMDVIDCIIAKCSGLVVEGYLKVHDLHPHKKQTVEFLDAIVANNNYKRENQLRESLIKTFSPIIVNYLTYIPQATFELLRIIATKDLTVVKLIIPKIEVSISNLENYRRPNAGSLRYSFKQLQEFIDKIRN